MKLNDVKLSKTKKKKLSHKTRIVERINRFMSENYPNEKVTDITHYDNGTASFVINDVALVTMASIEDIQPKSSHNLQLRILDNSEMTDMDNYLIPRGKTKYKFKSQEEFNDFYNANFKRIETEAKKSHPNSNFEIILGSAFIDDDGELTCRFKINLSNESKISFAS